MLQDETNEDMIEATVFEGQVEQVGHLEDDVAASGRPQAGLRLFHRFRRQIDGDNASLWVVGRQMDGLRARTAAAFENTCARRVQAVVVKQAAEGVGLIREAGGFARGIAMNVRGRGH
jgi:hypothetical protein